MIAHLGTLLPSAEAAAEAVADAEADAQGGSYFPGQGRRLVVRKRKRPVGLGPEAGTPQEAFQQLQHLAYNYNGDGIFTRFSTFEIETKLCLLL